MILRTVAKLRVHPAPAGWWRVLAPCPGPRARVHRFASRPSQRPSGPAGSAVVPQSCLKFPVHGGRARSAPCSARDFFLQSVGMCVTMRPASFDWRGSCDGCVAGPGTMTRSTRARHIATTTRPTIATTIWACGWCGRPTSLSPLWHSRGGGLRIRLLRACSPAWLARAVLPVLAADYGWRPEAKDKDGAGESCPHGLCSTSPSGLHRREASPGSRP